MTKYKVGDKVRIVNYGHKVWMYQKMVDGKIIELDEVEWYDMCPERVGMLATIRKVTVTQGIDKYGLTTELGNISWFHNNQLELVKDETKKERP